jgi:hypothetical protein
MSEPLEFFIHLPVKNDWSSIDLVRSSVQNCLAAALTDLDDYPDIAMVAEELLENAVKYGHWEGKGVDRRFRIAVRGTPEEATVEVENPIAEDSECAQNVFRMLSWISSFPDPADAYRERILEIASSPSDANGSGLGLARIAYEARASLSAERKGTLLVVRARMGKAKA